MDPDATNPTPNPNPDPAPQPMPTSPVPGDTSTLNPPSVAIAGQPTVNTSPPSPNSAGHQVPGQLANWQGAFSAVGQAFKALQLNFKPLLLYAGVVLIAEVVFMLVTGKSPSSGGIFHRRDGGLIALIGLIFLPYLVRYELALAKGLPTSIGALMRPSLMLYVKNILAFILTILLVFVGAVALIFPLLWIIPWVSLLFFPIVDLGYGPAAALKESRRLVHGNKTKVWALLLVGILLSIVGSILGLIPFAGAAIAAAIGLISQTALAILYVWLRTNVPQNPVA